ncbi:MAG: protein tyrosine phosphatase [Planctomycetota bacterium]
MSERIKVLFVCSKNQWRSPTAEAIYRDDPRVGVRSRGTANAARRTVRAVDLAWADLVLMMENRHRRRLLAMFPRETQFLQIEVLHIRDHYQFMDPELVEMIRTAAEPIIDGLRVQQSTEES